MLLQCSQGTEHVIYSNKSIYFNIGSGSVPAAVQPQDWAELGKKEIFGMHLPRLFTLGIAETLHVLSGWKSGISGGAGTAGSSWFCSAGAGLSPKAALGKGTHQEKCPGAEAVTKKIILGSVWNSATSIKTKEPPKGNRRSTGNCHSSLFYLFLFQNVSSVSKAGEKTRIRRIIFLIILISFFPPQSLLQEKGIYQMFQPENAEEYFAFLKYGCKSPHFIYLFFFSA